MTKPVSVSFRSVDPSKLKAFKGKIAVFLSKSGALKETEAELDTLINGALSRYKKSKAFSAHKNGDVTSLAWPSGLQCEAVQIVKLSDKPDYEELRKAGAALGAKLGKSGLLVLAGAHKIDDLALGIVLKSYKFTDHFSQKPDAPGKVEFMVKNLAAARRDYAAVSSVAEGVYFTRDLVNEPANILTTTDFAKRLKALSKLGVEVDVLDEAKLGKLGMRALLGVGQGSESPSKVVVMKWNGGKKRDKPFALVGKGVVFDTGGISLKPSAGMEDMTMDMGGAGVVSGVMRTLALRKAKANVVGVVGLVENMPDGKAQRPGDVVTSMKGDTIEVINTDAEGRLVLADILWYTQETFKPKAMVNLATLTGAIIVALGHENAGVFANDDAFADAFLGAAKAEGEGAWRMPMGANYDAMLKSRVADMRNSTGRAAGSVTAAQFLGRFIKDDVPWMHLDIAGVAHLSKDTVLGPKGATGWGVMALDRLIRDRFEG